MNDDQKSEQKSLAHQLSKCLNEKRRREQENIYIEELAELISASITDMNTLSVKPDKCAILQETVNQIRRIKEEESGTSEAVQQSQVSSSKPSIIANDVLGPLLLEALDGFLFVVNSHGKVEFVSENVTSYLKYSSNDLVEKSIYNIIHVGDHAQFSNSLLPMSLAHTGTTPNNITDDNGVLFTAETLGNKGRTFNCRMLIKTPGEEDGDVEVKQTYVSKYENMQISAVLQPYPDKQDNSTVGQSCLVCIARRLPLAEKTMLGIEQFTTKQDLNGKIIDCDTRGIAPSHYDYPDFKGHNLQDFCHVNDIQLLAKHIQDVKKNSQGTSSVYRFKLLENRYVFVRTQSRLFNNSNNQPDFIVSTHSIIRECDSDAVLKGSASTSLMKSIVAPLNSGSNKSGGSFQSVTNTLQGMGMLTGRNLNMYLPQAPSASPVSSLGGAAVNISDVLNINDVFDILPQSLNLFSSADTLNVSANSVNYTMAGATSSVTTPSSSSHTTWSNSASLKMAAGSMDQSQMQRSVSMTHNNPMSGQRGLSLNFQRSASLFDNSQKSPGFAGNPGQGTCNPNFAIPSPRGTGYGNYHNQRSPGSAGQLDGGRGSTQYSPLSYPQAKSTSPLMSPQPSGNWSRPPSSGSMEFPQQAQNPLQALQSMDTNPPSGGYVGGSKDKQFVYPTSRSELQSRRTSTDKKVNQSAKLTQLLTQNNPPPPEKSFCKALEEVDVPISYRDDPLTKMGLIRNSIFSDSKSDSSQQSPQPGPGTSPPEKPQSTSGNDELDHAGRSMGDIARRREENKILKQLLSQDDDLEDVVDKASASNTEQNMEVDSKNEAEPKKSNNILLKQLLNEEAQLDEKEKKANEKLQKLLQAELTNVDDQFDLSRSVSAPVESTSLETENFSTVTTSDDSSRTRHQSGPQQPTSTTQPTTAPNPQAKNGNVLSPGGSVPGGANLFKSLFPGDSLGQGDRHAFMQGKVFNMLMTNLWEKGNTDSDDAELRVRNKRKYPPDVDSTDDMDTEPPTSSGPLRNLSKRNVLLAKLLARKPPQENVVNTNITVNPCGIPQSKVGVLRNNTQKVVHVLDKVEPGADAEKESGTMHNPRDNPRTNPNVPFPGNTTPATAGQQQQQQQHHHQQSSAVPEGFGTTHTHTEPSMSEAHSALRQGLANLSNEQLLRYQQELNLRRSSSGVGASHIPKVMSSMSMEVDPSAPDGADPSDPLLAQILQQAQELQNDLNSGSLNSVSSSSMGTTDGNPFGSMMDDTTLLSQLDMVLKDSNLSMTEIDNLLGINNQAGGALVPTDMSEQMAISAIQKQLMSDSVTTPSPNNLPPNSASSSAPMTTGTRLLNSNQAFPHSLMQQQPQQPPHPPNTQLPPMDIPFPHGQQMAPGLNQPSPGYTQQGPRLPQPQALGNALAGSQNRPGFGNPSPNSMAYQVRQTLIMRQKQKQIRELEKRERIRQQQRQQQQQLLLRQQQAQQQFNQFPQRFQNSIGMDTGNNPNFPENLGELMKSGNAPNVTLPRNQSLPNPMSPRFVGGNMAQPQPQQQQQQQALQNMTPPPQLSPHYNQQKAGPGQWGTNRVNQSGLQPGMIPSPTMGQVQNSQFGIRSRQLSGSSMPSPGGQPTGGRFPYPADTQFNNSQGGQLGMYSQSQGGMSQQQQAFIAQNRLMQRQLSVTGRGSPRTPHSPFGGGSDSMLMSPHGQPAMSPNSSLRNQSQVAGSQLSPQFSQNSLQQSYNTQALSSNYAQSPSPSVAGSFSPQHVTLNSSAYAPSPQNNVVPLSNQSGFQDFDMSMFNNMGGLDNKVPVSLGTDLGNLGNNPPTSTSQYVKQELRNICNARSEKQLQTQQSHSNPLDPQQDQLQQTLDFNSDDISYNSILDEIDQMTQQHNLNPPVEDNVLLQSRQEARLRYEKFCQLSHPALRQAPQYTAPQHAPEESSFKQDADVKAANLFRNQLLSNPATGQQQSKSTLEQPHHVNIVQNEPRAPCEDMKPADQKNSLLQQLLSE